MPDQVKWAKNRRTDFIEFMRQEIWRVSGLRQPLEQKWRDWLELYRAPFDVRAVKTFPYEGASNVRYPFAMMSVNPILANEMQVLHATDNLWTLSPLNAEWVPTSKPLQDYLEFVDRHVLHMWDVNKKALLEKLKLGTAIYKVGWEFRQNRTTGYDQTLNRTRFIRTLNRPVVDHVSLANFYIPPEANAIDADEPAGAQWVAEKMRMRPAVLKAKSVGQAPMYPNYDKEAVDRVLTYTEVASTEHEQKKRELDRIGDGYSSAQEIEIYEIHARFDTTGDGMEDDVIVTMHVKSGEILQAMYNPYAHGKRPYHKVGFIPGDGFYDIGVCEMSEVWQSTISEMLNTSIDKARLANAPMIAFKEGANILPNEPIYPTKAWPMQDPKNDIAPFFLTDGRGNFDFAQLIGFLTEGGNEHVGVSSLRRGSLSALPSRTPATTVQTMLTESNTLFDLSIKDERRSGLSRVGLQVLQLMQQQQGRPETGVSGQYIELAAMVLGDVFGHTCPKTSPRRCRNSVP